MIQKNIRVIIFISLSLFSLLACTTTQELYRGETAKQAERIHIISGATDSGVWNTNELAVHYTYTSLPDQLTLGGYISISEYITNSYQKIRSLSLLVSFLDTKGIVISTHHINPLYSVNASPPEKMTFHATVSLPVEAAAFCFSYSGEFQGDSKRWDSLYIGKDPFY
ncbi:MAG: hypothetical protein JW920_08925 [Deltaproteobacteria bacterium]|nr:hypothetical protein [Deltaproteobacteria bacterium]